MDVGYRELHGVAARYSGAGHHARAGIKLHARRHSRSHDISEGVQLEVFPLIPQETTVPSPFNANERFDPAAMDTTPVSPEGTVLCPALFPPQATTVPSALSASEWDAPTAMATTFVRPLGTLV